MTQWIDDIANNVDRRFVAALQSENENIQRIGAAILALNHKDRARLWQLLLSKGPAIGIDDSAIELEIK